jgi:hypothetical protein
VAAAGGKLLCHGIITVAFARTNQRRSNLPAQRRKVSKRPAGVRYGANPVRVLPKCADYLPLSSPVHRHQWRRTQALRYTAALTPDDRVPVAADLRHGQRELFTLSRRSGTSAFTPHASIASAAGDRDSFAATCHNHLIIGIRNNAAIKS